MDIAEFVGNVIGFFIVLGIIGAFLGVILEGIVGIVGSTTQFKKYKVLSKKRIFKLENGKIIIVSLLDAPTDYEKKYFTIYGTITNNHNKYLGIKITAKIYNNEGVILESGSDYITDIAPGEIHKFQIDFYGYSLLSISDYNLSVEYGFY